MATLSESFNETALLMARKYGEEQEEEEEEAGFNETALLMARKFCGQCCVKRAEIMASMRPRF